MLGLRSLFSIHQCPTADEATETHYRRRHPRSKTCLSRRREITHFSSLQNMIAKTTALIINYELTPEALQHLECL
ncbi:unnamed protein product [Ilex paraguariensis]|uniref:Uncharacterized protein n=1 Tax=Ilex paraguariensis TaxID=185542 RepID=A0ABC8SLS6_9AQUA